MFSLDNMIYVKIDKYWFNLTNYKEHPGGLEILKKYHLKDATIVFNSIRGHCDSNVEQLLTDFQIKDNLLIIFLNSILIIK